MYAYFAANSSIDDSFFSDLNIQSMYTIWGYTLSIVVNIQMFNPDLTSKNNLLLQLLSADSLQLSACQGLPGLYRTAFLKVTLVLGQHSPDN